MFYFVQSSSHRRPRQHLRLCGARARRFPRGGRRRRLENPAQLAEGEYAVIYITEALAALLEHELDHYRLMPLPAIIPIPGVTGNTGMGIRMVKKSVEQAVGSDIIFNEKD